MRTSATFGNIARMENLSWHGMVVTPADLPDDAAEGWVCFVKSTGELVTFRRNDEPVAPAAKRSVDRAGAFVAAPGDALTFTLSLDDLVIFAQQGWQYPLEDTPETRAQIIGTIGDIKSGDLGVDELAGDDEA